MWADAQVWMDVAQLPETEEVLHHLHLNQKRHSLLLPDGSNTHAYARFMHNCTFTNTHLMNLWSVKKVTNIYSHKKSEVRQWAKDQINSLNCAIYVLPLFTLLSRCLCGSKWAIKWWMIMLACVENNSSDSENPTHTQSLIQTLTLRVRVNKTLVIRYVTEALLYHMAGRCLICI